MPLLRPEIAGIHETSGGVNTPWRRGASRPMLTTVQTKPRKQALKFGDVIAGAYRACGKRRAGGIIRLAVRTHLIAFRGQQRLVIY